MTDPIKYVFSAIVLAVLLSENALSFNFDTNYPIVYVDPYNFSNVKLSRSSYFGYSVLLYEGSNSAQSWIQVGAPRGSNPINDNETTGVVFRCGIKSTCYNVNMRPLYTEDTYAAEAYFGNSMDISQDQSIFAACGHRWVQTSGADYYMQGACFAGKTNENRTEFFNSLYRLNPQTVMVSRVRVYNLAMAQMGFSAQFVKEKDKNDLLIGMPGLLNWKGGVGLLSKRERPPASRRRRRRSIDDLGETLVSEVINANEIKYFDLAGQSRKRNLRIKMKVSPAAILLLLVAVFTSVYCRSLSASYEQDDESVGSIDDFDDSDGLRIRRNSNSNDDNNSNDSNDNNKRFVRNADNDNGNSNGDNNSHDQSSNNRRFVRSSSNNGSVIDSSSRRLVRNANNDDSHNDNNSNDSSNNNRRFLRNADSDNSNNQSDDGSNGDSKNNRRIVRNVDSDNS
ncbi:hypothetical protein Trydic_g3863, partial [Trypoxylus dichotomus]